MYGTVAKMIVKPGAEQQLSKIGSQRKRLGQIKSYVFKSDNVPNEFWMVTVFKDKATYLANADSPEQDEEFRNMMKYLNQEPEWHDGEVIFEE